MKLKSFLFFAIMAFAVNTLSAGPTVIIRGGRNGKYAYVIKNRNQIVCSGFGNVACPLSWETTDYKGVTLKGYEIIDYVTSQIEAGQKSGTAEMKEIPFSWEAYDDGFKISLETELILPEENEK